MYPTYVKNKHPSSMVYTWNCTTTNIPIGGLQTLDFVVLNRCPRNSLAPFKTGYLDCYSQQQLPSSLLPVLRSPKAWKETRNSFRQPFLPRFCSGALYHVMIQHYVCSEVLYLIFTCVDSAIEILYQNIWWCSASLTRQPKRSSIYTLE